MSLAEYREEMETCCRCSACKFIPFEKVKGYARVNVCPSIARYNFHAYSGGGRLGIGTAMLENELGYSDKLLEVVYNCQMCGACDVSCKYAMDMEVLAPLNEIRIECVDAGHTLPILNGMVAGLRESGRMAGKKENSNGNWWDSLRVKDCTKEQVEVVFHAGCRTSSDADMWKVAQSAVSLMHKAGVEVGIAGANEPCCGGRAYEMGYKADLLRQGRRAVEALKKCGARTLVTACAECYHAFKVLYDKFDLKGELEVLHTTEYFARLMAAGKIAPKKRIDMRVTYHDPCHLGRLGEPYVRWQGSQVPGHIRLFDPPKEFRRGTYGVYEPPRDLLKEINGITLAEMERIKEYAWCCGAGGGVSQSNPEFAGWTAGERIEEAADTGAQAIVSACPGCEKSFAKAIGGSGSSLQVFDVVELLAKAVL